MQCTKEQAFLSNFMLKICLALPPASFRDEQLSHDERAKQSDSWHGTFLYSLVFGEVTHESLPCGLALGAIPTVFDPLNFDFLTSEAAC